MMQFARKLIGIFAIACLAWLSCMPMAGAFCGFYVAKADANLFNRASQVIIAREGNRTILTMANDYRGDVQEFALVVPVPVVIKKEQVRVGNSRIINRLDAFTAPRLVEYFDPDPCAPIVLMERTMSAPMAASRSKEDRASSLGVTIEEKFTVGEYDILILSAKESAGLEIWLRENGYKIPVGAREVLRPYIRDNMKFFVAKVNLQELAKSDSQFLRPLLIAYESPKFMLPIRLGMLNANGDQDLIVYLLSPTGRAELTNYRTVKIPTDTNLPLFIKQEFAEFYKAMFQTVHQREGRNVAFVEYAWDMASCDPCAAEPLTPQELKEAGVFWDTNRVFVTRLHLRYNRQTFPEDLRFRATRNQELFQGRYVLNHPFPGEITCQEKSNYEKMVRRRQEEEIKNLVRLTNWNIDEVRRKALLTQYKPVNNDRPFWERIWK
ncbi:MAG: DUF2330 domain-containing protein [Pseudanabaenaceae cyanobacterium SKYGB_i_bin29]|nr:DUF2330 domain-containing protein [Pseudanabaenaceae cyanobacterium SKYG29]MDW8421709.1 DUF2330 domain-containing protein [Pseudanabaenaceae cyanobacterium SKYGB_i_bin29]